MNRIKIFPILVLLPVFLGTVTCRSPQNFSLADQEIQTDRDGKFVWPFFKLIVVEEACTTQSTQSPVGTCLTTKTCTARGGTGSGTCASGLAVCCILQKKCGESSTYNNTYFVSPEYPSKDNGVGSCTYDINYPSDVCQIRLDFIDFSMAGPDTNGKCETDSFTVTGGLVSTVPQICGENTGQHMYIDVNPSAAPLRLMALRSSGTSGTSAGSNWNIRVTQIPCGSTQLAPSNCLQYYTEAVGTVSSFNYQGSTTQPAIDSTQQISDHDYTVCIRPTSDFCRITWSRNTSKGPYGFSLTGTTDSTAENVAGTVDAAEFICPYDYILIPGGTYTDATAATQSGDRFCGNGFPTTVTSTTRPFNLYVHTDANEDGDTSNLGFSLNWISSVC